MGCRPRRSALGLGSVVFPVSLRSSRMVGHSWGGALVRYFVGNHSTGVVGVLYLDPTDILTTADLISMFDSIGAGKKEYEAFNRMQDQAMVAAPAPLRAEAEVVNNILRSGEALKI